MIKNFCFLILFLTFYCFASDTAVALYQKQDFDKALVLYAQKEHKSSVDWYMMANAAFYKEQYFHAMVFWYQSTVQGKFFDTKNIGENINRAREQAHLETIKELPSLLFFSYKIGDLVIPFMWGLALSFVLLWVIVLLIFYCSFRFALIRFILCMGFLIVSFFIIKNFKSIQGYSGIITSKEPVFLNAGPSDGYHPLKSIMPGDLVIVVAQNSDWSKIYYNNSFGWIASKNIMTIDSAVQSYLLSENLE